MMSETTRPLLDFGGIKQASWRFENEHHGERTMSLKQFVQKPHVRAKLECFRPPGPRRIPCAMLLQSRGGNPQRIGTAFDYLLRFELQRRTPRAEAGTWVAEYAEDRFFTKKVVRIKSFDAVYRRIEQGQKLTPISDEDGLYAMSCPTPKSRRVRVAIEKAKRAVATYRRIRRPTRHDFAEVAAHALRLASLEAVFRAGLENLPPDFDQVSKAEISELVDLLLLVPFDSFSVRGRTLLNPLFGTLPRLMGGADADLIVGDILIDVKAVNKASAPADYFDQLLGYFILARHTRRVNRSFPLINRLALYFARHGYLWPWDVSALHDDREFLALEKWFIDEAKGRHAASHSVSATRVDLPLRSRAKGTPPAR